MRMFPRELSRLVGLVLRFLFVWPTPNRPPVLNPWEWTFSWRRGLRFRPVWHRTIREGGGGGPIIPPMDGYLRRWDHV